MAASSRAGAERGSRRMHGEDRAADQPAWHAQSILVVARPAGALPLASVLVRVLAQVLARFLPSRMLSAEPTLVLPAPALPASAHSFCGADPCASRCGVASRAPVQPARARTVQVRYQAMGPPDAARAVVLVRARTQHAAH